MGQGVGPLSWKLGAHRWDGAFGGCVSRSREARPVDGCWQVGAAVIEVGHRGAAGFGGWGFGVPGGHQERHPREMTSSRHLDLGVWSLRLKTVNWWGVQ